jgi:hypothetical protein
VIRTCRPGNPRTAWWRRDVAARGRMEAGIRSRYPGIKVSKSAKRLTYELELDLEVYEPQRIKIVFKAEEPASFVEVFADGPTDSPHRYGERGLCMWHPADPPELRWLPEHGLVALIEMARLHLFREEYWRRTGGRNGGEWLGPEIHPGDEEAERSTNEAGEVG